MSEKKYMTPSEKVFLTELITNLHYVVESKKTDAVSASEKKNAWLSITSNFNSVPDHTKRNTKQLQKAWENIKFRRKKELSKEKQERMATGGGVMKTPPPDNPVDSLLDCVDIEFKDTVDSDEIAIKENYEILENKFVPIESTGTGRINDITNTTYLSETPRRCGNFEAETSRKRNTHRGSAVDREVEVRLQRLKKMELQDLEFHNLRMHNERELHQVHLDNERELHRVRLEAESVKLENEKLVLQRNRNLLN